MRLSQGNAMTVARSVIRLGALLSVALARGGQRPIDGVVFDSTSGKPITGATVEIPVVGAEASTGEDGKFSFSRLAKGRYMAVVSKPGYLSLFPAADWNRFTVAGDGEIHLRLMLTQAAAITGSVQDAAGRPARFARVLPFVRQMEGGAERLVAAGAFSRVDDQGNYRLYNLPPGRYLVGAVPDGASDSTLFPPVYTKLISLRAGETRDSVDFTVLVAGGHAIRGRTSSGASGRVALSLSSREGFEGPLQSTTTDAGGMFQFAGVPDGSYEITAASPAVGRGGFGPVLGKDPLYGLVQVEVAGNDAGGIEIPLRPAISLEGQFSFERESKANAACWTDAAVALHAVDAVPFGRPLVERANARGSFRFPALPPARYRVTVEGLAPGCFPRDDFPLLAADGDQRLNLILSTRASAAAGSVSRRGSPAPGSLVVLTPVDAEGNEYPRRSRFAVADQGGGYKIEELAPGRYRAIALRRYDPEHLADPVFWEEHRGQTREIVLEPARPARLDLSVQDIQEDAE